MLHGEARVRSEQWATVRDPLPGGVLLAFQRVPESKSVQESCPPRHLDDATCTATSTGWSRPAASRSASIVDDDDDPFQIMHDPEGNEFCLVT